MNDLLARLLGFDAGRIPDGAQSQFVLTKAPQSWGVFVLIALVAAGVWAVFYLYRREIDTCPRPVRMALACVRALVLIVLVIVFTGPALSITQRRTLMPEVVLLLDESSSMSIQDRYQDDALAARAAAVTGQNVETVRTKRPSRATLVDEALKRDDGKFLRDLARHGRVRVLSFANRVTPRQVIPATPGSTPAPGSTLGSGAIPHGAAGSNTTPPTAPASAPAGDASLSPPPRLAPLEPAGQGTNLAKAMRQAIRSLAGGPAAAIIIVSDGRDTAPPGDDPLAAADLAAAQNLPVFTVGVGDPAPPRNLKVADLFADTSVWRGDPFEVQAVVQSQGMDAASVQVELIEKRAGDQPGESPTDGTVVATKTVVLPASIPDDQGAAGSAQQTVTFAHTPQTAGQFIYSVRVPTQGDEWYEPDNVRSAPVNVLSEKARLLIIAGAPSWDYRTVQVLLTRDKTIDVSCWLQSMDPDMVQEGNTHITRLPRSPTELYQYDAVMMFDPDPKEFDEAWLETLRTFMGEHGGGLLYAAGPQFSTPMLTGFATRPMRDLLPVRFADLSALDVQSLLASHSRQWPLDIVEANLDHPMMRFSTDAQLNRLRWPSMPGVYWSFPAAEAKPASLVLIEHGDPSLSSGPRRQQRRPLLVTGQYGPGRTVYLGFNSTWRWRRVGKRAEYFEKFWTQTVRYLVQGRLLKGKRRGQIDLAGDQFNVGDTVAIKATLYDASYQPMTLATVDALVKAPGAAPLNVELRAVPSRPGQYEGATVAAQIGLGELQIALAGAAADGQPVLISRRFTVKVPEVEFGDPRLNKAVLADIAQRCGGRYYEIDQLEQIPAAVPDRRETIVVAGKSAELWDTNRLLILLVVLLCIEWAVRKRFKLL